MAKQNKVRLTSSKWDWETYHKTKAELKKALENHLKSIDLVFIYDNTNNDGDYEAHMESLCTSEMRKVISKL